MIYDHKETPLGDKTSSLSQQVKWFVYGAAIAVISLTIGLYLSTGV